VFAPKILWETGGGDANQDFASGAKEARTVTVAFQKISNAHKEQCMKRDS